MVSNIVPTVLLLPYSFARERCKEERPWGRGWHGIMHRAPTSCIMGEVKVRSCATCLPCRVLKAKKTAWSNCIKTRNTTRHKVQLPTIDNQLEKALCSNMSHLQEKNGKRKRKIYIFGCYEIYVVSSLFFVLVGARR